jgi:site-specific DNA recombinase
MIAAVYARKSTDQNLPDEEKSVTRQVERATAYALRKGWQVGADYVYQDDGISGAEFKKRPGLVRLMAALEPRPPFGVLIMSEESRLGREQVEAAWLLKQITEAGVRVFFYLEDRERTLDSAMDKVMLSLSTFAAEMEREKARQRTYDAMHRKASRGHVAGGIVYGYVNHRLADHVERRIVPAEAEIVRRIFQLTADGAGLVRIARTLTAEQVPPPRRLRPHGRPGWAPSAIRDMLRRDLYRGRIVWNKTQRVDRKGTRTKKRRPAAEWLQLDAPELRIVDDPSGRPPTPCSRGRRPPICAWPADSSWAVPRARGNRRTSSPGSRSARRARAASSASSRRGSAMPTTGASTTRRAGRSAAPTVC